MLLAMSPSSEIPAIPTLAADWRDFDTKAWGAAGEFDAFKLISGEGNAPSATEPTEVRIAHDGVNFYIRLSAMDSEAAKINADPPPFDDFSNSFPNGDHAEIWIHSKDVFVLAFDKTGNVYTALNYNKVILSDFQFKTRSTTAGWEAVLKIPMQSCGCGDGIEKPDGVRLLVVRHIDHGDGFPERSSFLGQTPWAISKIKITW